MSLESIKPYFEARISAQGLELWEDAFNYENIPSTKLDQVVHLFYDEGSFVSHNMAHLMMSVDVELRFFKKGYRTPMEARQAAIIGVDSMIKECCKISNSKVQPYIKNVEFSRFSLEMLDVSNDNVCQALLVFNVSVLLDVNK
jgi:hypothetical protein